ncbi:MAG: shikimate kinase [Candidatus Zixiibacteriota bacterium]
MSENAKKPNLFLAGMMGSGKTSTGRLAASELRYVFADTDKLIEMREGLSVTEIFDQRGEKHFRKCEREILAELCRQEHQVIATGGGMLADKANLEMAERSGLVVMLIAPVSELAHRLRYRSDRPLLAKVEPAQRLAELQQQRRDVLDTIAHTINTSGLSPLEAGTQVVKLYRDWLAS